MNRFIPLSVLLLAPATAAAQSEPDAPRPIPMHETVWIHEMTWMEVRDAIASGKTTAIIAVGGTEQNGPHVINGKHFTIVHADVEAIARRLGDALVAPVLPFNPGGDLEQRTYVEAELPRPGTLGVRTATFKAAVTDIADALRQSGFLNVVTIGDNGGDRVPLTEVAAEANARWTSQGHAARMTHIPEYYAQHRVIDDELANWGVHQLEGEADGIHSSYRVEATLMEIDPANVRVEERIATGRTSINGVSIVPMARTIEHGQRMQEMKVLAAVQAIRNVAEQRTSER